MPCRLRGVEERPWTRTRLPGLPKDKVHTAGHPPVYTRMAPGIVHFPEMALTLVRRVSAKLPYNHFLFRTDAKWTKLEIKEYIQRVYNVRVANLATSISQGVFMTAGWRDETGVQCVGTGQDTSRVSSSAMGGDGWTFSEADISALGLTANISPALLRPHSNTHRQDPPRDGRAHAVQA